MKKEYRSSNKKSLGKRLFIGFTVLLIVLAIVFVSQRQLNSRFFYGTTINGINCSLLTVDEAEEKLQEDSLSKTITFIVMTRDDQEVYSNKEYSISGDFLKLVINSSIIENALNEQKVNHEKSIELSYSFDTDKLYSYLMGIEELSDEYMVIPQNAYLQFGSEKLIEMVDEVKGIVVNFDEVYDYSVSCLTNGITVIDFTGFTTTLPEVLSTNETLIQNMEEINAILETTLMFVFSDETEQILDKELTSTWVSVDESGLFYFDVSKIDDYVEELSNIVDEKNATITFSATEVGDVLISVKESYRSKLDKEQEIELIKEKLLSSESCIVDLIYDKALVTENLKTYVELDITRQTVWLYVDGEKILESPCVTGNVAKGTTTPTGLYYLTYKTEGATLRGTNSDGSKYASYVNFWMPFNGGIGFHDASWRSSFGGTIYKTNGSHGCVNMPYEAAKTLYQYIDESIPIFVYAS